MPLLERARIEIYVPDDLSNAYPALLERLEAEFTYTFGGSTTLFGLSGSYLTRFGSPVIDRVDLIYTDIPARFEMSIEIIEQYADSQRRRAMAALDEEAVLVAVHRIYHSVEQ